MGNTATRIQTGDPRRDLLQNVEALLDFFETRILGQGADHGFGGLFGGLHGERIAWIAGVG